MPKREPEMIYFLHEWMTVAEVEKSCRDEYRVFDKLPSIVRIAINAGDANISPQRAAGLVRRHGARRAAVIILAEHEHEKERAAR